MPLRLDSSAAASPASEPHATTSGTRRAVGFGNYRLFARLGSGGMADVYLAIAHGAMDVNRLVVVKRLREEHANDTTTRAMFLDEARLAARLNHPNVIQTFEAGSENGSYFLAMEYVDGQPLSRVLTALKREGKLLEPRQAARICSDFLNGLHYAHELKDFDGTPLGIVHRDVSPQNVMVSCDGVVKLVDFGIAKAAGTPQTEHGVFKGKVAFMAPEQVRAENVDRRADLFAAGIILWEAVTGKHLMAESTPAATLYNLLQKEIPRASEVNPDVPPALDAIIARALQREVRDRYQTAKEMRDELEAFVVSAGGVQNETLGNLVTTLFADTREKVQAQIRAQLTTLTLGRPTPHDFDGSSIRNMPAADATRSGFGSAGASDRSLVARLVALDDGFREGSSKASILRVVTASGQAPAPTRRAAVVAWFFVPLLALGAASYALLQTRRVPAPPPVTVVAPATATTTATPTATTAATPTATPTAAETATATATATQTASAQRTATPRWVAPWRPTAPATTATTAATTAAEPPAAPAQAAPAKTAAEPTPTGRTFRRDL